MVLIKWIFLKITLIVIFFTESTFQKKYSFEFGSVFRQEVFIKSMPMKYKEYREVIHWSENYIEKRRSWSCPWLWDEQSARPDVIDFKKVNLIYTHNDVEPFHFESSVYDRTGQEHGITRVLKFGSIYRFSLSWRKNKLRFVHNITVSAYPIDTYNVYSHTFYIQNINTSSSSVATFLLPKFTSEPIYQSQKAHKLRDIERFYDINFAHMDNDNKYLSNYKHNIDDQNTEVCDDELGACDKDSLQFRHTKFQQDQLSVMSYNIWNMNSLGKQDGSYTERMQRVKQTILGANPDIIGLQEVRYEEYKGEELGPNQIYTLSNWLPDYQYVFQPAQMQPNSLYEGRTEEGVAIMSKYPIISHDHDLLFINRSNSADTHQRILLHVEIIVPVIGKVHVLNTHLSLSHEAREQSVKEMCTYVSKLEGPVILLGDMNAEPNEPAMKYLNGHDLLPEVTNRCKLRDIWLEKEGDDPGYTYNSLEDDLHKRIDYMLYTGWHQFCKVNSIIVKDDGSRNVEAASDHCPIVATFTFHSKETKT